MKKYFFVFMAALAFAALTSCSNTEDQNNSDIWFGYDYLNSGSSFAKLYASNNIEVGSVTYGTEQISQCGYLTATYKLKEGWELEETQVYVGKKDQLPVYDPKNPESTQFPFVKKHTPRVKSYTQYIPCGKLPAHKPGIDIVASAAIRNTDGEFKIAITDDDSELLTKL